MYAIKHKGKAFGPSGLITDVKGTPLEAKDADAYNRALEAQELTWLKTHPDKVTLYVAVDKTQSTLGRTQATITTWLGTVVSTGPVWLGSKQYMGFGESFRRAVTCILFGVKYHGWYMESSGNYVRLRKAKRQ